MYRQKLKGGGGGVDKKWNILLEFRDPKVQTAGTVASKKDKMTWRGGVGISTNSHILCMYLTTSILMLFHSHLHISHT